MVKASLIDVQRATSVNFFTPTVRHANVTAVGRYDRKNSRFLPTGRHRLVLRPSHARAASHAPVPFAHRHPYELSGGMQQRAAFCQAMVHDPKIVLLDEPLGKLDAMTREAIRTDLQALWMQRHPTVVFVTHSIEEAFQLSTHVAIITPRPGRIERIISVDLPYPRDFEVKSSPEFIGYVRQAQEIFRGYGVL
eukprot:gene6397-biopygen5436